MKIKINNNINLPSVGKIKKAMDKAIRKIADNIQKEQIKTLGEQHAYYKLTGDCDPVLDFMISEIKKKKPVTRSCNTVTRSM